MKESRHDLSLRTRKMQNGVKNRVCSIEAGVSQDQDEVLRREA